MGIWDLWTTESKDYTHGMLDQSQVPPEVNCASLQADAQYIQLVLRRMHIVNARSGFKKFYAAVYSDVGAQHGSGMEVSFRQFVAPPELQDVSAKNLDRSIVSNQILFGPTPYRGGSVRLNAALLAVQSADLVGPFLEILTDLATTAGTAYIPAAQPFIKPLTRGIDLLRGSTGSKDLEIYLVTNLMEPATGAYVVMRAPSSEVSLSDLRLKSDFSLAHAKGWDISKYPYMVFSIEASNERVDWKGIPALAKAYDEVMVALEADDPKAVDEALVVFWRTVLRSDDLIDQHARNLFGQVKEKTNELLDVPLTAGAELRALPTLDEFNPFRGPD